MITKIFNYIKHIKIQFRVGKFDNVIKVTPGIQLEHSKYILSHDGFAITIYWLVFAAGVKFSTKS